MNKFLIMFLVFIISANNVNAQMINGEVDYSTFFLATNLKNNSKNNNNEDNKRSQKVKEKVKLLNSKLEQEAKNLKIKLLFNEKESYFFCEKKIFSNKKEEITHKIAKITHKINTLFYYQTKSKFYIEEIELGGDLYLIEKENEINSWKLLNETKKIGVYNCYKAIRNLKYLDRNNEKKSKIQIVWYTPDISVPFGPKNFVGFPGLVLKVEDGSLIYEANTITLNTQKKVLVKKPTKGMPISEEKFDEIVQKSSINFKRKG